MKVGGDQVDGVGPEAGGQGGHDGGDTSGVLPGVLAGYRESAIGGSHHPPLAQERHDS